MDLTFKKYTSSLVIWLIFGGLFLPNIGSYTDVISKGGYDLKSSTNSEKIHVNNNWTATKAAGICTGGGTVQNPYTLKNLIIDAGGIGPDC